MKRKIRLTESTLRKIVKESVSKMLKEVKIDYLKHYGSSKDYEWDTNPNNERGYTYNKGIEYSNVTKEDYVGLMRRLERLTNTEWSLIPQSSYSDEHSATGYDSFEEYESETLEFTTRCQFKNRVEGAKKLDLIEKVANAFFNNGSQGHSKNSVSVDYNGEYIILFVCGTGYYDTTIKGHRHSKELTYGKDYAGYPMHKAKSSEINGYYHPYPNSKNSEGNYKLENWERFMSGQSPLSYKEWNRRMRSDDDYDDYDWD